MVRRPSQILCAFLLLVSVGLEAQESDLYGKTVATVDFRPDIESITDDLFDAVTISPGELLTVQSLQDSIKALYAVGRFRDVRADVTLRTDGNVDVLFRLYLQQRIGTIGWNLTESAPPGFKLVRELDIGSGDILSLSAVDRASVKTRRQYVREGYLEALVDPQISFDRDRGRSDIVLDVTLGPRATIGAIRFLGDTGPYSAATLLEKLRSKPGKYYDIDEARRDSERLREFLASEERRLAEVTLEESVYDSEAKVVDLTFEVDAGPIVEVLVEGVPEEDVRKVVRFDRTEEYSLDKIDSTVEDLRKSYQSRGYYLVNVDADEVQTEAGPYRIVYRIDPGERYELGAVGFDGNETFTGDELSEVVATAKPGVVANLLARVTRRPLGITRGQLEEDAEALEGFYRLEGFIAPQIGTPRVIPRVAEPGLIDVTFPIEEGLRIIVSDVIVEGTTITGLPDFEMKAGAPLNPQLVAEDVVAIQQHYASRGYFDVRVRAILPDNPTGSDPLTYRVTEGDKITIGTVSVSGNSYTDSGLIFDKARLREGDPLTWTALIRARQRLYGLGIFSIVEIIPTASTTRQAMRDIEIRVQEGKFLTVSGSLGYSTEDRARGTASISHRNIRGKARYVGLETTISQRVNRVVANYREPTLFGYDLPTQITLFRRDELRADGRAKLESLGSSVEITRIVRGQARWGVRYEYRLNDCVSGDLCELAREGLPILDLEPENQEIQISSVTPSFFWDRRNDPVSPSEGFYAGLSVEYAFPLFRAETNFLKGFAQATFYQSITDSSQLVFSTRLGATEPLQSAGPGSFVPFAERFLAGGEQTHRAFALDKLGIPCQTLIPRNLPSDGDCESYVASTENVDLIPLGGNALLIFNLEYRFPIFEALKGAIFIDAGNVWRKIDEIDTSEIRTGAGVGVRYLTPVGPLRLDAGFNLDPEPWEEKYKIFLTLGYAF